MYYTGGSSCCSNNFQQYPYVNNWGWGGNCGCNNSSSYAIILVLFILLVIIIGCRTNR